MDQTLSIIMTVCVALVALALLVQAAVVVALYGKSKALIEIVTRIVPKVEALLESTRVAVDDGKKLIDDVTVRTNDILDATRKQLARVDEVLEDASARARVQLDQAEMVLDDAMRRTQQTIAVVHSGIMKPLREIQAVTDGVRAAIGFLFRSRRSDPAHATADEEMFI